MKELAGLLIAKNPRPWGDIVRTSFQIEGDITWYRTEVVVPEIQDWIRFAGDAANKIVSVQKCSEKEATALKSATALSQSAKGAESAACGTSSTPSSSGGTNAPPISSPEYWRWKQMHDLANHEQFLWRDARSDATRLICAALDNDVLALGQSKGKRLDILLGMVDVCTTQLVDKYKERNNGT